MTTSPPEDDDLIDGLCDPDIQPKHPVTDEEAPYVALFCDDLDGDDEHVLDAGKLATEATEWHELFDA